jgi:NitT/TauT family transport system permease protein
VVSNGNYVAIKNRVFENAFVLFISVFESIPVFSFIPIILLVFIRGLGGSLGVEVAADFLVFTAIVWNIWIGIYQAFKTVPEHLLEVSANYELGFVDRMRFLYIPFSIPRIAGNIFPSFSDALFYITVSEVFTVGSSSYQTFGIGTIIAQLTAHGDLNGVYYSLLFIAIGVIAFTSSRDDENNYFQYSQSKYWNSSMDFTALCYCSNNIWNTIYKKSDGFGS